MSNPASYGREYEAQARIITKLHEQIQVHQRRYDALEAKQLNIINDAMFYRVMTDAIKQHETLQNEWINFVTLLRLTVPDLEQRMKTQIKHDEPIRF